MSAKGGVHEAFKEQCRRVRQVVLVELLDTSRKMVREWERAGMPRNDDRTYSLFRVLPWLRRRWVVDDGTDGQEKAANSPELERWRKARADMAELELSQRLGEVVLRSLVEEQWGRLLTAVKQNLLGIPNRLAAELALVNEPAEAQALVDDAIRQALEDLVNQYKPEGKRKGERKRKRKL